MLEHDDVRRIVDADGPKFAKDVLAEQAVETYPQNLLEFIQIHQGDALAGPHVVGEGEAHRQEHGFARHAGSAAVALRAESGATAVCPIQTSSFRHLSAYEPAAASPRSECQSQALDSNDNEPPFIDRKQTFSAKTSSSACWGTVPVAYLT